MWTESYDGRALRQFLDYIYLRFNITNIKDIIIFLFAMNGLWSYWTNFNKNIQIV